MKIFLLMILCFGFYFPSTVSAYTDVPSTNDYYQAITYLADQGIIQQNDLYYPNRSINRAEFLKIILLSQSDPFVASEDINSNCFHDVKTSDWFAPYVCVAKEKGLISGYAGNIFKPENTIILPEALKIITTVYQIPTEISPETPWYIPYLNSVQSLHIVPSSFQYIFQPVTRGQMAEMIWRIKTKPENISSTNISSLLPAPCYYMEKTYPPNIDEKRVEETWLQWYNDVRTNLGLSPYIYNIHLKRSAIVWSSIAKQRGSISHKRDGQTAYYDYKLIEQWFANLGLRFQNINRSTFTENIGWGIYSCSQSDCTDDLLASIRTTFDFFMSEKGKSYAPHYKSIVQPYFKEIGLGIVLDPNTRRYYLTVHYGTQITSQPGGICTY